MNKLATVIIIKEAGRVPKWVAFGCLSKTTNMTDTPLDTGSHVRKSIEMSSQMLSGIGKGCNKLANLEAGYLIYWQIK